MAKKVGRREIYRPVPPPSKVKCTTRLDALDVPRSSAHKAKEFVGFRTLFSHFFVEVRLLDTHSPRKNRKQQQPKDRKVH